MARVPDLIEFCNKHGLKMLTVAELIRYRLQHERYIVRVAESPMPTEWGEFRMIAYESEVHGGESHVALVMGRCCAGGKWGFGGARAGAGAFALPGGRRVWDDAVRLPADDGAVTEDDCGGGTRGADLSAQRRAGDLRLTEPWSRDGLCFIARRGRGSGTRIGTSGFCVRWGWVGRFWRIWGFTGFGC